jgi:hypothetical protein
MYGSVRVNPIPQSPSTDEAEERVVYLIFGRSTQQIGITGDVFHFELG